MGSVLGYFCVYVGNWWWLGLFFLVCFWGRGVVVFDCVKCGIVGRVKVLGYGWLLFDGYVVVDWKG